jgi:hypothetical protein
MGVALRESTGCSVSTCSFNANDIAAQSDQLKSEIFAAQWWAVLIKVSSLQREHLLRLR